MTTPVGPTAPRRGRPSAASREAVPRAAMRRYLRGERIDVQAVAAELSLGRTWFGSRENLIGEVLVTAAGPLLEKARAFLFNDAVVGIRGDVERLRQVEAALLGGASRQLRCTQ
jgi:hypothetical protein